MRQLFGISAFLVLVTGAASAQTATQTAVIERLRNEGYSFIEIKEGLTQTKVEATRGTEQLEFVYDNETGAILAQEVGRAEADYIGRSGVEIDRDDRDFVGSERGRERDDDDADEEDDDDDKGGRGGRGGNDDDDDNSDDDDGDDDGDDGDDDGGDDGDDDHGDNSGRG